MASKKKAVKIDRKPRQKNLPGMTDRAIQPLNRAALKYADIRDQRVALSAVEVEAKGRLLDLMHAHKKKHYQHGNILIDIVPEGEKLKVKIKKADDLTEEELQGGQDEPEEEVEVSVDDDGTEQEAEEEEESEEEEELPEAAEEEEEVVS